jgi:hypothetical protein
MCNRIASLLRKPRAVCYGAAAAATPRSHSSPCSSASRVRRRAARRGACVGACSGAAKGTTHKRACVLHFPPPLRSAPRSTVPAAPPHLRSAGLDGRAQQQQQQQQRDQSVPAMMMAASSARVSAQLSRPAPPAARKAPTVRKRVSRAHAPAAAAAGNALTRSARARARDRRLRRAAPRPPLRPRAPPAWLLPRARTASTACSPPARTRTRWRSCARTAGAHTENAFHEGFAAPSHARAAPHCASAPPATSTPTRARSRSCRPATSARPARRPRAASLSATWLRRTRWCPRLPPWRRSRRPPRTRCSSCEAHAGAVPAT